MANFYKQTDDGEYIDADKDVDDLFRQKSDEIISKRIGKVREKEIARIREEIEDDVRNNATETIKSEAKAELEQEYKAKLEESESKAKQLDIALRRKTIAAEYGFKTDAEQFLGDGDVVSMRAKADSLKNCFGSVGTGTIEKQSEPSVSKLQEKTGIVVEI